MPKSWSRSGWVPPPNWLAPLLLAALAVRSGAAPCPSPAPARSAVRFEFHEGLVWVQVASASARRPLSFLLDSGASVTVLDTAAAREMRLSTGRPVRVRGLGGTGKGYWPTAWRASLANHRLPELALVLDLSLLSNRCGRQVDGLVGLDFLRRRPVLLDFARETLQLDLPDPLPDSATSLPLEVLPGSACLQSRLADGRAVRLRVDTGCAAPLHLVNRHSRSSEPGSVEVVVGVAPALTTSGFADLEAGPRQWRQLPVRWHPETLFAGEDGLLGTGFLARHGWVLFDVPGARLVLGPDGGTVSKRGPGVEPGNGSP